jgi:hypothetical protein
MELHWREFIGEVESIQSLCSSIAGKSEYFSLIYISALAEAAQESPPTYETDT